MICENCRQEYEGDACLHCLEAHSSEVSASGSPTLIKGLETPYRLPARPGRDQRAAMFAPLIWIGAVLIAVPWVIATNEAASVSYPGESGPSAVSAVPAPDPAQTSNDPDQISMVIHIPAGHWVDTGIDMCSCTRLKIQAVGTWQPPSSGPLDANGSPAADSPSADNAADDNAADGPQYGSSGPTRDNAQSRRDRLTTAAPYGELVGKVGSDPFVGVGSAAELDGDQFNEDGTLRLGMNAGRYAGLKSAHGELTIYIKGDGSAVRPVADMPLPVH